jgi:hypothetical protein
MTGWEYPQYCLFQPVAESISNSELRVKLEDQFAKQTEFVLCVPLSVEKAINGSATHWLPSHIEDTLYLEMCESEIEEPKGNPGDKISRYYIEAAKYVGRISSGNFEDGANNKHRPIFEIHTKDFSARLQAELKKLAKTSPTTVGRIVQKSVFRIFRARHKRIFFEYIQHNRLNWRFVVD